MREGWECKKIKEVCSFIGDGDWIESKDQSDFGIRLIQTGNIGTGIYRDKADKVKYISNTTFSQLSCTEIFEGDCLLSRLPDPIGRSCLLPKLNVRTITAVDCTILRFKENILPTFFIYYTQSNSYYKDILSKTTGTTRKRISRKNLEKIDIPYPPKSTQLSIVSELDKLNELIRIKKEQLKDYDALAQSIFYEMFGDPVENEKGWEVKELSEVCHSITDGDHMPPPKTNEGIPFLTISNINKEVRKLDFSDTFFVSYSYYDALKEDRKPRENDLLYTVTGSYGIPVVVDGKSLFCFQRHIALLRPNLKKLLTLYLCYWCLCPSIKHIADRVANGIAQKTVSLTSLRRFSIILPPLPLQQSFAQKIEQIERQKAAIQKTITDLETLLAARMQYWFD